MCTYHQALSGLVEVLRSRVWGLITQLRHDCSKVITEAALMTSVKVEEGHQRDPTASIEERQILGNAYEPLNEDPGLHKQPKVQQRSKHPDAHQLSVASQLFGREESSVTESGASREHQQLEQDHPLQQQDGKDKQLHQGNNYDAYLVHLLSAEAQKTLAGETSRRLHPQVKLAREQPLASGGQNEIPVTTHRNTLHSLVLDEQKHQTVGALAVGELGRAALNMVRPTAEETTPASLLVGQAAAARLPAATMQLQWIREALILLRRIDDPQHVQLQRRKKAAMTAGAFVASPSPTQPAGSTFFPEDGADASAAVCSGSYKCVLPPPSTSSRLLYVMWIGVGGGPWGGRSNTWFNHRRYASSEGSDKSPVMSKEIALDARKAGNWDALQVSMSQ